MNVKERFLRTALCQPADRGVYLHERFWTETLPRWRSEGMPDGYDFGWDFDFHAQSLGCLGVNIGYEPAFEQEVIRDEGETQVIRDVYGILKRVHKTGTGMPQFVEFPVHDRASWEKLQPRLDPELNFADRLPQDWQERVQRLPSEDFPLVFTGGHLSGFFSFLRELAGDQVYYLFQDDPGLVREIIAFQAHRLIFFLRQITQVLPLDGQFIWEDMCYKNGPLIGPATFRSFLLPAYQRVIQAARACGVKFIYLDSDGRLDALLPLWLEAGVTMIEPFEVNAGMDVCAVKAKYGSRLALAGGIDKRALALDQTTIRREVERVRPAFEQGGYIPQVDHAVPPDVSWSNFQYYLEQKRKLIGLE